MNEILDLDAAVDFHLDENYKAFDEYFNKDDFMPVGWIPDPLTISNHYLMLAWLFNLVANKYTTSYQSYLDRCEELSIPHYIND